MNLVPKKQLLLNEQFQSTKFRNKELCVDKKLQETIGDVYCPTCRSEECVYISTKKTTSFYYCKKWCHVLNFPFRNQKPDNYNFWWWWYTLFCKKNESRLRKRKTISIFVELFSQSQPSTSEPQTKKCRKYSIYGLIVLTPHWLIQLTKTSFTLSLYALSVYIKATRFSQSLLTILSGLSTLDLIWWLWL